MQAVINKIRLLISVNDEKLLSQCISAFALPYFNIQKCDPDSVSVEVSVMRSKPHVVLLSSNNMKSDAMRSLISNLNVMHKSPIIINLYTYEEQGLIEDLESLGVSKSYSAPFDFHQIAEDIREICSLMPVDINKGYDEIKHRISEIMNIFNFNNCMQGYNYIRDSIFMAVTQMNRKYNFSKDVYPAIAEKYETSSTSVERAVRVAISNSWKRTNENVRKMFFNQNSLKNCKKPTNSEFILIIADYIRVEFSDFFEYIEADKKILSSNKI